MGKWERPVLRGLLYVATGGLALAMFTPNADPAVVIAFMIGMAGLAASARPGGPD